MYGRILTVRGDIQRARRAGCNTGCFEVIRHHARRLRLALAIVPPETERPGSTSRRVL